jgi:hypothetical protein
VTGMQAGQPGASASGADDLSYGQLAAARKAARYRLDSGALVAAERGILAEAVQRVSAAIDARPVDLDGAHERCPGWRFSREGEELVARSTDGLCTLRADSPEALEAKVQ